MKLTCRLRGHYWEIRRWPELQPRIECIRCGGWIPYSRENYDRIKGGGK